MVRLISGRVGKKSKRKHLTKKQLKQKKKDYPDSFIQWASITEIKNELGISLPSLKLIMADMGLWSGRTVTLFAMDTRMARYNRGRGIYEWNKKRLISSITDRSKISNRSDA